MAANMGWSEIEDMIIIFNIVSSELLSKTEYNTKARSEMIESIATDLLNNPAFAARLATRDPLNTIKQHIRVWISNIEGRRGKPPQTYLP